MLHGLRSMMFLSCLIFTIKHEGTTLWNHVLSSYYIGSSLSLNDIGTRIVT